VRGEGAGSLTEGKFLFLDQGEGDGVKVIWGDVDGSVKPSFKKGSQKG
jgi:hypothetical protein